MAMRREMFGGDGGVSIVHPDRLKSGTYHPPVRVSEVRVGGRPQPAASPVILTPEARRVEIVFAALDYSAPEQNRYAYRLEGYDRDWIETTAQRRMAVYENLPPGDYRLLLRGSNRDGLWPDTPTVVQVSMRPAWFQTWWCHVLEALAGGLLMFAIVQLRTTTLRRKAKPDSGGRPYRFPARSLNLISWVFASAAWNGSSAKPLSRCSPDLAR